MIDLFRLDVFRVGCEFFDSVQGLAGRSAALRDQLDRASSSIVLNVAEGAGRTTAPDKRRFYLIARGSAYECAAILELLRRARLADPARCAEASLLLERIVQMLTRLSGVGRRAA